MSAKVAKMIVIRSSMVRGSCSSGGLPHNMTRVSQRLDLGDYVSVILFLRSPKGVVSCYGETDKG